MEHSLDRQTPYTPRLGLGETVSSAKLGARLKGACPAFLEFFAGSGLVAEGLKDAFQPVWANDICAKKAAVYTANHGANHFHLGSITSVKGQSLPCAPLAWASLPCQELSLADLPKSIHSYAY